MRFAEVDALHKVAGAWTGERKHVEHGALEAFSQLVGKFCAALGETAEEGYWAPVVRKLKRARWDAATTPLPLASAATGLAEAKLDAVPRLRQCRHVAPELAAAADDLADRLTELAQSLDNPLGDAVRGELAAAAASFHPERVAVLLRSSRYRREVGEALSRPGAAVSVLTAAEFSASNPLDLAIVVGPTAWFPSAIVRASRARRVVFVYPSWIRDTEPQESLLAGNPKPSRRRHISRAPLRTSRPFDEALPMAPAEDWVPRADWQAISAAGRRRVGDDMWTEPVDAWLFALASGDGVYLEAGDGSRAYIAEIEEDDVSIHQELTSKIVPGDFVVLRTEGEGDYVRPIADVILGRDAPRLRQMQAGWKQELGAKLAELGSAGLRRALEGAGAIRASDQNIRQWLRPESIRPRDPADFSAITAVIGTRDLFRELWDAMGMIDSAHRRAGFQVRALLVEEIRRGDRSALMAEGWADFEVEEIEGEGALRVARVDGRAPETMRVPRTRTRRPFPIGRDLWLG